jgi:putative tricarboxylic transport membrane protein
MKWKSLVLDPDVILMVVLGVFAGAFLLETRTYNPTAALFPRLVSIISLIFIIWTIGQRYLALRGEAEPSPEREEEAEVKGKGALEWYWSLGTMVGYFVLIYLLGFTLVTLIYLLAIPFLLGYRKVKIVVITGVLWTVAFITVFTHVLHARIPEGIVGTFLWQFLKKL